MLIAIASTTRHLCTRLGATALAGPTYLLSKLAGGSQHKANRSISAAQGRRIDALLDHWDGKAGRFAAAGLCAAQHIPS